MCAELKARQDNAKTPNEKGYPLNKPHANLYLFFCVFINSKCSLCFFCSACSTRFEGSQRATKHRASKISQT